MGVFHVFQRFIIILYSLILTFIVFINLVSFAGIDVFSGGPFTALAGSSNNFSNSYFGFASIINAIDDYPSTMFGQFLPKLVSTVIDGLSGGVYRLSLARDAYFAGEFWTSLLATLEGILDILFAPVMMLLAVVGAILIALGEIYQFLWWFSKLIGGYYNIPLNTY